MLYISCIFRSVWISWHWSWGIRPNQQTNKKELLT